MSQAIAPSEYYRSHPDAHAAERAFCSNFATMRDAWLSDECEVWVMLRILERDPENRVGITAFRVCCMELATAASFEELHAARAATAAGRRASDDADARGFADVRDAYSDDERYSAHPPHMPVRSEAARVAMQAQRDELRRLFPRQFA